jgi:putative transposase
MKAYSPDLRERIVRAVEHGMTKSRAARTFAVSLATVKNYVRQWHQTGSLAAKPIPGRPRGIPRAQDAVLVAQLRQTPDATLEELVAAWKAAHQVAVSVATMSRAIRRVRWTRKKRRWVPRSATR